MSDILLLFIWFLALTIYIIYLQRILEFVSNLADKFIKYVNEKDGYKGINKDE